MKHTITRKEDLNAADYVIDVIAPEVAKRFRPGNFAVLITVPKGERIPMSIERAEGDTITMYIKRLADGVRLWGFTVHGQFKVFPTDQLEQAKGWIKEKIYPYRIHQSLMSF